jgi:mRNA interferase MazF
MMVLKMLEILRGEVWVFDPEPTRGREVGKKLRPAIVVSNDTFNNGPAGLVIIIPLTSKNKKIPCHVSILLKDGGVKEHSFAMCEQIRCISKERLVSKWGPVRNPRILSQIAEWVGSLLSLDEYF